MTWQAFCIVVLSHAEVGVLCYNTDPFGSGKFALEVLNSLQCFHVWIIVLRIKMKHNADNKSLLRILYLVVIALNRLMH
jgi:hypothetical protein